MKKTPNTFDVLSINNLGLTMETDTYSLEDE